MVIQKCYRWTDRWMDRQMDGRTDGQTDGRTDGQTDRWIDGETVGIAIPPPNYVCGGGRNKNLRSYLQ